MNLEDKALTIKDVAKFLNISNQMVYNLIKDGNLTAFKIGAASRVLYSDLLAFIERQKNAHVKTHKKRIDPDTEGFFEVQDLSLELDEFKMEDISFKFPLGKILTILGPSGSGKTLLLKSIGGIQEGSRGAIFNGNRQIDTLSPAERNLGFVFEDYALFPQMDVQGNIEFPMKVKKLKANNTHFGTDLRMKELDIHKEFMQKLPKQLPEGIKQLVAIARERNNSVDLFLMDEPMTKLDNDLHKSMRVFIKRIIGGMGKTVIISSNNTEDALVLSDYLAVIDHGRLLQFGETWDVYHNPLSLAVLETTSLYGVNVLDVTVKSGEITPYKIYTELPDGKYILAFRAEETEVSQQGIDCTITRSHFFDGKSDIYYCETEDGQKLSLILQKGIEDKVRVSLNVFSLFTK